jgi:Spy/CpxP family protein refolding chaperone
MSRLVILIPIASALAAGLPAHAQPPYTGLEARPIKALSEQQTADLRAGRGMGLALAAELNGYPGPMHVLELADALALSDQQRTKMRDLFAAMRAEAIPLGDKLIAQEAELDRQFANKTISPAGLAASMVAIGTTQAELRQAHLKYHLSTVEVLTPAQVQRYGELRGYKAGTQPHGRHQ